MSIKDKYVVRSIPKEQTYDWLLNKHYAHRIPSIMYSFGLYDNINKLVGICCYGLSGNINNNKLGKYDMIELQRLVINDNSDKNVLSLFVSLSLKYLPKPLVIISYADPNKGHHGYIYQSTNWIYTGIPSDEAEILIDGIPTHRKSLFDKHGTSSRSVLKNIYPSIQFIEQEGKHRYFYFLGNKTEVKDMKKTLNYLVMPYPKGDNKRYDASYNPKVQGILF